MNQMRCISFAGPGLWEKKRYCRGKTCIETDLVQEAIFHLYKPDEMIICLSDPKAAGIASTLEARNIPVHKLWIPFGTDESQLWDIFGIICNAVRDKEDILFDITAGCHSLPFMTFLAASYLRSVRSVSIAGVIYAPVTGDDGFCRFVDLMPLMNILDWISGVEAFIRYVDAEPMYRLLHDLQGNIHRSGEDPNPPVRLTSWASLLWQFSDAVRLARPVDALYAASGAFHDIDGINEELNRFAPHLIPVLAVTGGLLELAAEPDMAQSMSEYVRKQIRLIAFQLEKGLFLQAVTLGREVLITLYMIRMCLDSDWRDADVRHEVSRTLTGGSLAMQNRPYEKTRYSDDLIRYPDWKELVLIWTRISDLRNNLAHCGMNLRDDSVRSIRKRASDILSDIERFFFLCVHEKRE
ncbi:MAG TPA: TM1812 family CRISPR-associated protein [Methanospirillum sp.]|uniref:TM1812 family CRISPR-associated protein n=1 Tax=Methanospirillum sp. TaxID=45200 RepID=UPI002C9001A4|nr:TM1812 family CRISPR-associated protein [Methanospirillum sp.]HOJ95507.1 TM1812 family CRISPR-associated protein [Methanospirillum sp.]